MTLLQICRNSKSSKLSCMSSLPARMKKIKLKMKVLDFSQDFSHYMSMWIFSRRLMAAKSAVHDPIWSNFELVQDLWLSSLPAKMKKIRSKKRGTRVHNIIHQFFRRARADNSGVGGGIWPIFELIQAFMHVLVTCKNEVEI